MSTSPLNIGFVGLGIMGTPMAGHLIKAGHHVHLRTRHQVPDELVAAGGTACASAREVAERSDVIITMVPDTPDVGQALFGEHGVAEGLSPGKLVIDMSSISPVETKEYARKIEALGCDYLDAPVSGGDVGAKNATLSIMCGGKPEVFERARPVLALMGRNITRVATRATARPARSPTRSSWRSPSMRWPRACCLPRAPAPTRPGCAKPCSAAWPARASSTSWASA